MIVEYYFSIPGIGELAIESINKRDYLAVQGVVLVVAVAFVAINKAHIVRLIEAGHDL